MLFKLKNINKQIRVVLIRDVEDNVEMNMKNIISTVCHFMIPKLAIITKKLILDIDPDNKKKHTDE